jgi:dTDP-glucose 4,6-dehydratase
MYYKILSNILVTGGCGFIGSNFINYIVNKYPSINIINLDALYYCSSLDNIKVRDRQNYEFVQGNVCDYNLLVFILKSKNIDTIIHFAAQSHVDNSFLEPLKYTDDNVKGTHTLLEAIKNTDLNIKLIHISTDEVYGESMLNERPKNEQDILCPTNPYAASKAAAEMFVNSYIHSFKLKAIITRGNNVYGPNQYPEKLIPKFIESLKNNKKCTIQGDGSALRSFIHVDDVCRALECIMFNGVLYEIYNIGSDSHSEMSVLEVTKRLIELIKNTYDYDKYIEYIEDRPFNDKRYFISNDKVKLLGWKQEISFIEGIKMLI